jgi:TPR repeat protein
MDSNVVEKARELIEMGNFESALELLRPLIESKNPSALFLYSMFSLSATETEEAFEKRSIECLQIAAAAGYAPACYALGACLEVGDMIEKDSVRAACLFQQASDAGYSNAKFRHGLNLYYGSNGVEEDKKRAMSLIHQAENDGVQDASDFINLNKS